MASAERVVFNNGHYLCPVFGVHDTLINDFEQAIIDVGTEFRVHQQKLMTGIMERVNKFISPRVEKIKAEGRGIHFGFDGSISSIEPNPKKI